MLRNTERQLQCAADLMSPNTEDKRVDNNDYSEKKNSEVVDWIKEPSS